MTAFVQEWIRQFRGFSRNIRLFLTFLFVWNVGLGMYGLVYNLYVKELGFAQTTIGHVVGMTAIASAVILVPAGVLNDRVGPKKVISFGVAAVICALTARALYVSEHGLLVSAFIGGMAQAIVSATVMPFMANNSRPDERVHLFSLNLALVMAASVVGNMLGGMLSDLFPIWFGMTDVAALRSTLMIGVGIAAFGLLFVVRLEAPPAAAAARGLHTKLRMRHALRHHRSSLQVIGLFAMLGLLSSTAGGMVVPYLNVYFEDRFAASKTVIGIVVSLGQGATAVAYLIGPLIARRFGEARSVIVLQLSSIPFLLITAYSSDFYLASAGYLFRQALMNAANPFWNTIKMKYVDRSLRGLASSSGEAVFNLGWFLASPVSTGLVAHYGSYYGYAYAFSITAVVYTLIAVLFYVFFGKERFAAQEETG